jgi:hypothetical protein
MGKELHILATLARLLEVIDRGKGAQLELS